MLDSTLKNACILLVDDQPSNLAMLENLLAREGYVHLKSVDDSRQFFSAFEEFQPDIILLDLHMPHLDGFAIMEGLRERIPAGEYLPILVLTADITPETKLRALGMGARDFLAKPLDLAETSLRVKNLLETRYLHQRLQNQNALLEEMVTERTRQLLEREQELQRANAELHLAYDATIEGWSRAMDLRDKETEGHTQRVTQLTLELARRMGINGNQLVHIRRGALLHDMGKLGIPDGILLKPGKLTDDEWMIMRKHPQFAYDMLWPVKYLRPALDIPYCHHEKWDGTGYPRGLKGEEIPLAARLFAVADVYDALTSDRPYRPAWTKEKTLEYIRAAAGSHFDPAVVQMFIKMMNGA